VWNIAAILTMFTAYKQYLLFECHLAIPHQPHILSNIGLSSIFINSVLVISLLNENMLHGKLPYVFRCHYKALGQSIEHVLTPLGQETQASSNEK
jgi:hypothetical protein